MGTPSSLSLSYSSYFLTSVKSTINKKKKKNKRKVQIKTRPRSNKFSVARDEPSRCVRAPLRSAGEPRCCWGRGRGLARGRGHRLSVTTEPSVFKSHCSCFDLICRCWIISISSDQSSHVGALAPNTGEQYRCTNFCHQV